MRKHTDATSRTPLRIFPNVNHAPISEPTELSKILFAELMYSTDTVLVMHGFHAAFYHIVCEMQAGKGLSLTERIASDFSIDDVIEIVAYWSDTRSKRISKDVIRFMGKVAKAATIARYEIQASLSFAQLFVLLVEAMAPDEETPLILMERGADGVRFRETNLWLSRYGRPIDAYIAFE